MSVEAFNPSDFKQRLRNSLRRDPLKFRIIKVKKHQNIYVCGDQAEAIYFVESGNVKLLMLSPEGKESIFAIHTHGDTFGESCLRGKSLRHETAIALDHTTVRRIPCNLFLTHLKEHSLVDEFMNYLISRMVEQQQLIAHLTTLDSEHILAWILLLLGRKLGRLDPPLTRLEHKFTHEELSSMVGTTRPRITTFMKRFRDLGLIAVTSDQFLIVHEKKLSNYLARVA